MKDNKFYSTVLVASSGLMIVVVMMAMCSCTTSPKVSEIITSPNLSQVPTTSPNLGEVLLDGKLYPTARDHTHTGPYPGPTTRPEWVDKMSNDHASSLPAQAGQFRKLVIDGGKPYTLKMANGATVTRRANLRPVITLDEVKSRIQAKQGFYTGRVRTHSNGNLSHGTRERVYWDEPSGRWSGAYEGTQSPSNYYFWGTTEESIIGDTPENNAVLAQLFPGRFLNLFAPEPVRASALRRQASGPAPRNSTNRVPRGKSKLW